MKHISCYYKRLKVRKIKIAILAVFVSIFFCLLMFLLKKWEIIFYGVFK